MESDRRIHAGLPRLVDEMSARHPGLSITLAGTIGEAPEIHAAIAGWVLSRLEAG